MNIYEAITYLHNTDILYFDHSYYFNSLDDSVIVSYSPEIKSKCKVSDIIKQLSVFHKSDKLILDVSDYSKPYSIKAISKNDITLNLTFSI
jgi:hypothetical protein